MLIAILPPCLRLIIVFIPFLLALVILPSQWLPLSEGALLRGLLCTLRFRIEVDCFVLLMVLGFLTFAVGDKVLGILAMVKISQLVSHLG